MNDLRNLKYKIPYPMKGIVEEIAPCIYESIYCQYSAVDLAMTVVSAALINRSLERVAKAPSPDDAFWRIRKGIEIRGLERVIKLQRPQKRSHIDMLMDGHDDMYSGEDALGRVGTKPKDGTSYAFKYLVAYSRIEPKGVIGLKEMFDGSVTNDAIDMIKELHKDYIIDCLKIDGEFYKAELIEYVSDKQIPYIVRRSNTGNIRELNIPYNKPYFYKEEVKRTDGRIIHIECYLYRYKGIDGDFYLASNMKNSAKTIRKMFKTRWEIETGFREIERVGIKTTSTDFLVRLFFFIISCIVYNMWMKLRFRFSIFTIQLDDMVEVAKDYVKLLLLFPHDISGMPRRRHIRLHI